MKIFMRVVSGAAVLFAVAAFLVACAKDDGAVKVGVLHSLSGTMSISEVSVKDASLLAIEEINAAGGLLGKQIEPVIEDGASDWPTFAEKAQKLIERDKVSVVFGGWTSASRKAMLPVFEDLDHLLFYPVQYEGMEASKNIVYTGAVPNQQMDVAVNWLVEQGYKKFYLLGSDYVYPRTANLIINAQLAQLGASVVGEEYTPLGHVEYATVIEKIKNSGADAVINTLNGDSNVAFFKQLKGAGLTPDALPVMSSSIAEEEIKGIGPQNVAGHYAAWNYFMSMDTPANKSFVERFQQKYGADRVTDDPIEAGYFGVYLWAEAVKKAGTFEVAAVREALRGISYEAPEGKVTVDAENNHTYKIVQIGRVREDGQFDVLFSTNEPVKPVPFSPFISSKKVTAPGVVEDK